MKTSKKPPLISIIIPTRNAARFLESCLESIKKQTYSRVEVLVVDNYSTDETRDIARRYSGRVITAGPRPPHNDFFTAPIQRRIGAKYASGDYLFFVDADMVLSNGLIEELRNSLNRADAVVVPEVSFGSGFWTKCKAVERSCYLGDEAVEAPRFIKRLAYEKVGGWRDEIGGFDDWDLNLRIRGYGFKVVRSRHRLFHNEGCLTMRRLFMKKYRMGKSVDPFEYSLQHINSLKMLILQLTPVRLVTLLRRVTCLVANPTVVFGVMFMKTIEGAALAMGFVVSRTTKSLRRKSA